MTINSHEFKTLFVFHHIHINHSSKGLDKSNISWSNLFVLYQKSIKVLKAKLSDDKISDSDYEHAKTGKRLNVRQ